MTTSNDFAKQGQNVADKAADQVQAGIRNAHQIGDKLSNGVEQARSHAGPSIQAAADQAQTFVGQGIDSARAAAQRVYDGSRQASDSIVTYTKENPVKAILIAAASGALLLTLVNALSRSRE
jgi:ElaB/YqjD/DUF883 family membrane-anchored ribosome-binding protein